MKLWCFVALLLADYAQAGELLPMSGKDSEHMQRSLIDHLRPAVEALPDGVKVQPILESIDISGRGKRVFWGPLAGSSHVVLRIRILDGERSTEEIFSSEKGAWRGLFRPGRDYEMVESIATQAAQFVSNYSGR